MTYIEPKAESDLQPQTYFHRLNAMRDFNYTESKMEAHVLVSRGELIYSYKFRHPDVNVDAVQRFLRCLNASGLRFVNVFDDDISNVRQNCVDTLQRLQNED